MPLMWNGLAVDKTIEQAMWGDVETLCDLASCICCCDEHTFESCPARVWSGCRGSGSMTRAEMESWAEHYRDTRRMTPNEFFGLEEFHE